MLSIVGSMSGTYVLLESLPQVRPPPSTEGSLQLLRSHTGLSPFIASAAQVKWSPFDEHILASAHYSSFMVWDKRVSLKPPIPSLFLTLMCRKGLCL